MKVKHIGRILVTGIATMSMVAALGLTGCGGGGQATEGNDTAQATELQIFAANSLEKALPEVQALYTEQHPEVTFADTQFKASGDIVEKIAGGAAPDVLICASSSSMDDAADYINADTRKDMFTNELVVVTGADSKVKINSIDDIKNIDGKVGIGEPNAVPAGKYALQALESVGLCTYEEADGQITDIKWDKSVADKMDAGSDKVGTVANHVATGDFAAGFVYTSDVYRYDGIQVAYTTPSDSHKPILYPGAVLKDSKNAEVAADFLNFCMTDPDAQQIFANYGFELVSE